MLKSSVPKRNKTKPKKPPVQNEYYRNKKGQFKKQGLMYRLRR